ncbi:MAG: Sau3AI family type II restriction endonuclease [Proteocatella sp.]
MDYEYEKGYDETCPNSIEKYAKNLIGKTFLDIREAYFNKKTEVHQPEKIFNYENKKHKGGLGELIEECFFHYKCNNDSKSDFDKAGVELKVTPYRINKNGSFSAKERLIITMIDYFAVVDEDFLTSHFWNKSNLILIIYYLYQSEVSNRLDYRIDFAKLFSPPKQDLLIIKNDFEKIVKKIREGKAHELSEGDTLYLGAATKAATSADTRKQPFSSELAKPRAFAFKNSYMTYILNNYIVPNKITYEVIAKDDVDSFEDYVVKKIRNYKGYSIDKLCFDFKIEFDKKPKNLEAILAYRILGIKGNSAEEFVKANIVVKTIRISNKNSIKESMSFPTFKFKELIEENWEESTFGLYLSQTKFLFVVYKEDSEGIYRLRGSQFWNIPYKDLEENVYKVWEQTRKVINDGLIITKKNNRNYNNFPNASENRVCHVRPHARDSNDTYELPDGRQYPKQCFWLNNKYILSQLNEDIID